jgi:glycerol-3-phosphate dehydrogenase
LNHPLPANSEVEYLLDCINSYKPTRKLTRNDVVAAWSGIHPVVNASNEGGSASPKGTKSKQVAQSEHCIIEGPMRLIAVFGGELDSYRLNAEEVVDKIVSGAGEKGIELSKSQSRTKRTMIGGWKDKNDFLTQTAAIAAKARKQALEPATLDHLIESYGEDAQVIVDLVERQSSLNERICPDFPPIMAEVAYCVISEMTVSLEDLLFRRLRLAILHQIQCKQAAPKVAALMQSLLNWDDARAALELQSFEKTLDQHIDSFRAVALSNGKPN